MPPRRFTVPPAALMLALASGVFAQSARPAAPSDADIRKILAQRIDDVHQSVGIVVGVIEPGGRRIVSYGKLDQGDARALGGDTLFEIGSVTKVFTSLVLSDMARRGEVTLDDPVAKFLPAGTKVPERNGRQITLVDLATHTSGLPRMPSNINPRDPTNPYADYTVAQLYAFLSTYSLPRDIGAQYEYSNLGGGLLGHALALRAGTDYETLVRTRITAPLKMSSTSVSVPAALKARLAVGHDAALRRTSYWQFPTLTGAGGIESSANDLLTFLSAAIGYDQTPLAPAMAAMLDIHRPTGSAGLSVALGWHVRTNGPVIWHNGGTGGFSSFIGYVPATRVGVVVLSNAGTAERVDDIGAHILDPTVDVLGATAFAHKTHTEVPVDPKIFDGYVGRYEMAPNFVLTISRAGDRLFAQATGQGRFQIFPEGEKDFFAKGDDIQITFQADAAGKVTGLIVHQQGNDTPAKRIQ